MTTILLIRHTLSEGNTLGICSGQLDLPLAKKGFEQAQVLAGYLKEQYLIEAIYTSDLCRAVQTAQPTADAFGLVGQTDPDLREVCAGEFQGVLWKKLETDRAEANDAWQALEKGRYPLHPKGAETYEEVAERMERAIMGIVRKNAGKCVALVSHARALRIFLDSSKERDPVLREYCSPWKTLWSGSITELVFDEDGEFCRVEKIGYHDFMKKSTNAVE